MTENEDILNEITNPLGTLFDSINFYKIEDLDKFISEMNNEQALYCIVQASQAAYKRNAYTLIESELLSKAIRKLSTPNVLEKE